MTVLLFGMKHLLLRCGASCLDLVSFVGAGCPCIWRGIFVPFVGGWRFLSGTEYHFDADYNSRLVGVVVVVVLIVVFILKNG